MPTQDDIVAAAQSVPQLLALAKQHDPSLYAALTAPSALSVWATPVGALVAGLAARYGLGWDKDTCAAIAGAIIVVGTAVFHRFAPGLGGAGPPPKALVPLVLGLGLGAWPGCATPAPDAAQTLATRYTALSAQIAGYAMGPRSDPQVLAHAQQCEDTAWPSLAPMVGALQSGAQPSPQILSQASTAVTAFEQCLTSVNLEASP